FPKLIDAKRVCTTKLHGGSHLSQAVFHYIHFILNGLSHDAPEATINKTETLLNLIAASDSSLNHEDSTTLSPFSIQKLQRMKNFVHQNFNRDLTPITVA
ncbi:MAG: hypothetical protein AAGD96_15660, partial [Chloroflexota bacterium]